MSSDLIRPSTPGVPLRRLSAFLREADALTTGPGGRDRHADAASSDALVTGVSLDSRAVARGDLYAALPGFHVHGASFVRQAVAAGAVAVLTDDAGAEIALADGADPLTAPDGSPVPVLVVAEPRTVLGHVAATVYGEPARALTMIGITGTNGKTTTAYLVESALRAHGHRTGLIGTVETRIGDEVLGSRHTTPEATDLQAILAAMRERGLDSCVMEVSSHALHQHRVDGIVYDVALFTNLSQDHLDYHPTMEDYFLAKADLFTPERARAGIVMVDDDWGRRLAVTATVPVTTVSTTGAPADWQVHLGAVSGGNVPFRLVNDSSGEALDLVCHLPGDFNIANTALAALCLRTLLPAQDVAAAMAVTPRVPGRMEVVAPGGAGMPRCVVDFAHTPDAVAAALHALRPSTTGRLVVVLGAGGDRDRGKRGPMGAAAARIADVVVVTDDNPRTEDAAAIRAAVLAGATALRDEGAATAADVHDGGTRSAAIRAAVLLGATSTAASIDTVVILGKGHETGQEIDGVIHPFDDREAVRSALTSLATPGGHA